MSKSRVIVLAVVVEGRSKSQVARDYQVSRYWVQQLVNRFHAEGDAMFEPRSRRPLSNPSRISPELEDRIVELRKELDDLGAGAVTIGWHLEQETGAAAPAISTIWRVLTRNGFVTPQPRKRPKSSYVRFEADQPNASSKP